jgi:glyoxylase-like metal-dependent hydrolase (beta-lactamase superfamily II)
MTPAGFTEETGLEPRSIAESLKESGVQPEDIDIVINTHLHDDHCGNNSLFAGALFYAHRDEIAFCRNPHPLDHRYDQYFIKDISFTELDSAAEIVPGVKVMPLPGHTVGTLGVEVETGAGPAIITGFCCNARNFPASGPAVCPGVHVNAIEAWDSIQRVKESGALILPMHELELKPVPASLEFK